MAKKKEMTPEEKLTEALVPADEQPYEVPDNWCWTKIGNISEVVTGGTPNKKNADYYGGDFPFYKPADLDSSRHMYQASEYLSDKGKRISRIIPAGSTAVCCIGSIGKSGFLEREGTTNQQINSLIPKVDSLFVFFYANTDLFVNQLWSKASSTTISIVNKKKTESCYVPLPPMAEQTRIVNRIESLFAKLDEAKEKIQHVLDGAELRKSAILHKAFTGELTRKWRQENGVAEDSWEEKHFEECISTMQNGLSKRKGADGDSFAVLRLANIGESELQMEDLRYILLDAKEQQKYCLKANDVLMIRVNGSKDNVGKQIFIDNPQKLAFCDHLIRIQYNDYCHSRYMCYFATTREYKNYITDNLVSSAGQNTISRKGMQNLIITLPIIAEQQEIVRLLDSFLAKEKAAMAAAEQALASIDLMKKSILARAFRGQLGTNDPTEESSVELLKEILARN